MVFQFSLKLELFYLTNINKFCIIGYMKSPYKVLYYIHDMFSNYPDSFKVKYEQILLKEEAITRAKGLLRSLKAYYRINKGNQYYIRTYVVDYDNEIIGEFK